jgi:hypothetical protein
MNQRLTRKEIKRDEVAEWFGDTAEFLRRHRTMLILSTAAVVAVLVLAVGGYWWLSTRSAGANELLARAITVYAAPIDAIAPKPDDPDAPSFADEASRRARAKELFEKLANGFSFADAADVADVYLGRIAVADGDLDGAARYWREFVDAHRGHVLAGEVRVNLLALDRQRGRGAEVAGELEAMLTKAPDDRPLPGDVILSELATTYEQLGRDGDAKSTWSRLAEEYPQSAYAAAARQKAGPALQALAGQGF